MAFTSSSDKNFNGSIHSPRYIHARWLSSQRRFSAHIETTSNGNYLAHMVVSRRNDRYSTNRLLLFQHPRQKLRSLQFRVNTIFDLQKRMPFILIQKQFHIFPQFNKFIMSIDGIAGWAARVIPTTDQLYGCSYLVKKKIRRGVMPSLMIFFGVAHVLNIPMLEVFTR